MKQEHFFPGCSSCQQYNLPVSGDIIELLICHQLGNVTGYPGVSQGNLHPYPSKPIPTSMGAGFNWYRCGFCKNPRVYNPWMGMCPKPTVGLHTIPVATGSTDGFCYNFKQFR
ncbi:hypothetical protein BYT27DRAFT_7088084 [Phlegmacium glaucopus]|nr:hypothetical protein BYT27DRAFT_7088084 [Phlegmacium glaucopus]